MSALRDPNTGCPWDRQQTMKSIVPHSLEEIYELIDAVERDAMDEVRDELGDLLFHVAFYSQLAAEAGCFDFEDVAAGVCEKLQRRHPHVFAGRRLSTQEELSASWEKIKQEERRKKNGDADDDYLDHIATALPAVLRALKLQKHAARAGLDWRDAAPVAAKVEEELGELKQAMAAPRAQARVREELGDLLFAVVNLARHLGVDAETALREANRKFEQRFRFVRGALAAAGRDPVAASAAEMEELWEQAKQAPSPGETDKP